MKDKVRRCGVCGLALYAGECYTCTYCQCWHDVVCVNLYEYPRLRLVRAYLNFWKARVGLC